MRFPWAGVDPRDYIWWADPRFEAQRLILEGRWSAGLRAIGLAGLVLATVVAMHLLGYRQITPAQERALGIVEQVDPDYEVDASSVLAARWGQRADAYRLIRIAAIPAKPQDTYPYLAALSRLPAPSVSPGNGPALGWLIDRLLAVAASMDRPGVIDAFEKVAILPEEVRAHLFAGTSPEFLQRVTLQAAIDHEQATAADLDATLRDQQTALQKRNRTYSNNLHRSPPSLSAINADWPLVSVTSTGCLARHRRST
jgi:hypothetical protein